MTTTTFKAMVRNPLDRARWVLLALLVTLSLWFNLTPVPVATSQNDAPTVVDLYAPPRNAEEQAAKNRRVWAERAAMLAAQLSK